MTCVPGSEAASGLPPCPARNRASASANSSVVLGGGGAATAAKPLTGPMLEVCGRWQI